MGYICTLRSGVGVKVSRLSLALRLRQAPSIGQSQLVRHELEGDHFVLAGDQFFQLCSDKPPLPSTYCMYGDRGSQWVSGCTSLIPPLVFLRLVSPTPISLLLEVVDPAHSLARSGAHNSRKLLRMRSHSLAWANTPEHLGS